MYIVQVSFPANSLSSAEHVMNPCRDEFMDIPENKHSADEGRVRRELENTRASFRSIVEKMPDGVIVTDTDGRALFLNNAARELFGLDGGDIIGQTIGLPLVTREHADIDIIRRNADPAPGEAELRHVAVDWEGREANMFIVRDVTEQRRSRKELVRQKEYLQSIIDNIPVMIAFLESDMKDVKVNKEFTRRLGWTQEDADTLDLMEVCCPDEEYRKKVVEYMNSAEKGWHDFTVTAKSGETVHSIWSNLRMSDGALVGIGVDLTDRIRAEEELKEAMRRAESASRAKSDFLSNMSHEFRTPLNGILGMAQLLKSTQPDDLCAKHRHFVDRIEESGKHLLTMIETILDIVKIDGGELEMNVVEFAPADIAKETLERLSSEITDKNIAAEIHAPAGIIVRTDREYYKTIMFNLVENAVKFSHQDSTIRIDVEAVDGGVRLSVADDGPGITDEHRDHIFENFFQGDSSSTKRSKGIGMSLGITKKLAEVLGGTLTFESEHDIGTAFFFFLPGEGSVSTDPEKHNAGKQDTPDTDVQPVILLVEDNLLNAEVIMYLFQENGCRVVHVENAREGIEYARSDPPALILMDIQLPGMDGIEALKELRGDGRTAGIPAFALTAYAMKGDRERILAEGFDEYVTKPIDASSLLDLVRNYIGR